MQSYGSGVAPSSEQLRSTFNYHLHCRSHDYWAWAIASKTDGHFIGSLTAGITEFDGERWFEPAWILPHPQFGHGFATEAAVVVVDYAINQLQWKRLLATASPTNASSLRVIEKAGFKFLRDAEVRKGRLAKVFVVV